MANVEMTWNATLDSYDNHTPLQTMHQICHIQTVTFVGFKGDKYIYLYQILFTACVCVWGAVIKILRNVMCMVEMPDYNGTFKLYTQSSIGQNSTDSTLNVKVTIAFGVGSMSNSKIVLYSRRDIQNESDLVMNLDGYRKCQYVGLGVGSKEYNEDIIVRTALQTTFHELPPKKSNFGSPNTFNYMHVFFLVGCL